ncbi:hemerythrin domain-containing protein [Campylobacter jejuni]|uniref:hemerythrin domain-containing protein n=1 Tax=Campylobacter jejuni TaxID=197 RepID=UPI0006ACFD2E|nr:hemerythrin domain-containing protein [Campylobacter jejuni]
MPIKWTQDFSINNALLDEQHNLIFQIANLTDELIIKIKENPEDEEHKANLKNIVLQLFQYIKTHFKDEEDYMEKIDFPLKKQHKNNHKDLINKTKQILNHSNDVEKMAEELSCLTKEWILEHFANDDLLIDNYVKKAIDLKEIHYTLEQYIKLKSLKYNLTQEKHYSYICTCSLYIHEVPQTIHEELVSNENSIKCHQCNQNLTHLDQFDHEQNYETLEQKFLSIERQINGL